MSVLARLRSIAVQPAPVLQPAAKANTDCGFSFSSRKLIEVVEGQDYMDTNAPNRHNANFIHLSDLRGICPRAYVLAVRHKSRKFKGDYMTEAHGEAMNVVWAQGRATEEHIRKQFIKKHANQVYGTWICACKDSSYVGFHKSDRLCQKCKVPHQFKETPIYDMSMRIVGNADLPVLDMDGLVFTEIKSIKKDAFDALTSATPEHVTQVFAYRDMAARNRFADGMQISKKVVVIYASKDFNTKEVYKEYLMDTTDENYQFARTTIDMMYAKARLIRDCINNGTLPEINEKCHNIKNTMPKGCPMFVNCMACHNLK